MNRQMTKTAAMLVLIIGLAASAAKAQLENVGLAPVGIFAGYETALGNCEASEICYGNTFVLNSYGEKETHHLTVSLNYLNTQNHNGSGGFGVAGGTWSLVVYRDNAYAGTLFGDISSGAIVIVSNSNAEITSKQVELNLRTTGGFGIFCNKESENISGAYSMSTDLRSKETNGRANFNF